MFRNKNRTKNTIAKFLNSVKKNKMSSKVELREKKKIYIYIHTYTHTSIYVNKTENTRLLENQFQKYNTHLIKFIERE